MPDLIRFGGGLNAVSPIVTSLTAFGRACGPLLVLSLLLSLELVAPLATFALSGFLLAGGVRCGSLASPVKPLAA